MADGSASVVVRATAMGVRMGPRKVSLVASLVRGRSVADALVILEHTPKRAALAVLKTIASAKANATTNHQLEENSLVISSLSVTAGSRLKRFRAGARGMAKPYQKRTAHVYVELSGIQKVRKPARVAKKEGTA